MHFCCKRVETGNRSETRLEHGRRRLHTTQNCSHLSVMMWLKQQIRTWASSECTGGTGELNVDTNAGWKQSERQRRKSTCKRMRKSWNKGSNFRWNSSSCDRPCSGALNDNEGSRTKSATQFEQRSTEEFFFSSSSLKVYGIEMCQCIILPVERGKTPFLPYTILLIFIHFCNRIFPFL